MNKISLSLLFAFGILFNHQASALGLSSNDIKKICKKVYDDLDLDLLRKGQLGAEAFNELDPSSTIVFAIGKSGTIYVKVTKSGKVYKLNAGNVFELVGLDSFEEIVYANFHRTLTFTQLSQGSILGLEWVEGTSDTFWIIPSDSSSEEQSDEVESEGVNSNDFTVDSSDIYETSLSQDNSLSLDSSIGSETFDVNTVEYHSENDMEALPYNLPSLDLFEPAPNSNNQAHFTSSDLLRMDSFGGWEEKAPLFGMDSTGLCFGAIPGSPPKKKFKAASFGCGSEFNLSPQPKQDDNDGDEDYGRFFNIVS